MKTLLFLFSLLTFQSLWSQNTTNNIDDEDYEAPYHTFQVGGGGSYNAMINKYGINTKFNVNLSRKISFGPEFTYYFGNTKSTSPDYFYELNLSGSLVELGKVSFFGLTGITYQQAKLTNISPYSTNFQGINLGFGMQYRKDRLSMFAIAKVTSSNSNLWLTAGACYYFDIEALRRMMNNKYHLNKRTRKDN
ncbi:MAG: hypothetical protein NT150_03790 [Bacteroidetes bacterium]|nr:hypothetical protein [Bacteroidota bacterium]